MPSGVLNMLSFFPAFPILLLFEKSCHFVLPASSSLLAFTFLGILAGLAGPSLTLLGSFRAWLASAGLISAAAEITLEFAGRDCGDGVPGIPSALRFRASLLEIGLMSLAVRVSVVEYDLNETI